MSRLLSFVSSLFGAASLVAVVLACSLIDRPARAGGRLAPNTCRGNGGPQNSGCSGRGCSVCEFCSFSGQGCPCQSLRQYPCLPISTEPVHNKPGGPA